MAAAPPAEVPVRAARSVLRRQLREQKRVRMIALAVVVVALLGAPILYFGILFATRDPVLNSLDRLGVPSWAAQSPQDRIISGSRWCFIDCRLRERTLVSERELVETTEVYQAALREAGWVRWDVPDCPLAEVDGDYSCWTRDEYTLDLWVRPPECAYDPVRLRPDLAEDEEGEQAEGDQAEGDEQAQADPDADPPAGQDGDPECSGSIVEIKMQNRVADGRGLPESEDGLPGGSDPAPPTGTPTPPPVTEPPADAG